MKLAQDHASMELAQDHASMIEKPSLGKQVT